MWRKWNFHPDSIQLWDAFRASCQGFHQSPDEALRFKAHGTYDASTHPRGIKTWVSFSGSAEEERRWGFLGEGAEEKRQIVNKQFVPQQIDNNSQVLYWSQTMSSFWCEYECVLLKDKLRHIKHFKSLFEHLSIPVDMGQCQTWRGQGKDLYKESEEAKKGNGLI